MITVVLHWIFLSERQIGCYLSDQFLAKTYATYQNQFFSPILQLEVREIER